MAIYKLLFFCYNMSKLLGKGGISMKPDVLTTIKNKQDFIRFLTYLDGLAFFAIYPSKETPLCHVDFKFDKHSFLIEYMYLKDINEYVDKASKGDFHTKSYSIDYMLSHARKTYLNANNKKYQKMIKKAEKLVGEDQQDALLQIVWESVKE